LFIFQWHAILFGKHNKVKHICYSPLQIQQKKVAIVQLYLAISIKSAKVYSTLCNMKSYY